MARKLCTICNIRTQYTGPGSEPAPRASNMCNPCFTEGSWENTHEDEGHENYGPDSPAGDIQPFMEDCWICHPELNLAKRPQAEQVREGHRSPRRPQINHRACEHPQTPKARRECRNAFWKEQAQEQAQEQVKPKAKAKAKTKPADTGVQVRAEYTEAEKASMAEVGAKTAAIGEQMAKRKRTRKTK